MPGVSRQFDTLLTGHGCSVVHFMLDLSILVGLMFVFGECHKHILDVWLIWVK